MLKAIPGISKKILVVSIAALFLVSMVLFVSPGKIYGDNHTQADFKAFDGVDSALHANGYTVSSGITATYTGSNTIKLTGYAPIVTPWFGSWTTFNYVTIGIKLPTDFAGTPSVYQTGVIRYDSPYNGVSYKMSTIGDGSTPLATAGAALGYLDYSFAANSNNTKKDGLVKLKVIWNASSTPEYFTIDISELTLAPAPGAPVGLAGVAPTSALNYGKITGTTTAMEYKLSADTTWTAVTGIEINGLAAGAYVVRFAAKNGFNAGAIAAVTVPAYVAPTTTPSTPPKPLTPEEIASLNLSIGQQIDLYGATNIGFTKMLYDNILGRAAESEGLNNWVTDLNEGKITLGSVVYNFVFSKELESKISAATPEEFITFLYKNVFDRNADPDGYNNWVSLMQNGMSKEDVLLHFIDSGEFKNICEMFGLKP